MKRAGRFPGARAFLLALVLLPAGGYLWLRAGASSVEPPLEEATVREQDLNRTIAATGVIRPKVGAEIQVGSRVSGIVTSLPVKVGDRVEPGDRLALIDAREPKAEVAQARAALSLAEAELATASRAHDRARTLAAEGVLPSTDLDAAAGDLEMARARVAREGARLESASIRLEQTEIRAPIRGIVAQVATREGETVAASFAAPNFVTIIDLERLEVRAYVDETDIGRIFLGQQATFSVDTYPGVEFTARVEAVDPKAELLNGVVNYIVRLEYEKPEEHVLRPEMTAHVRLLAERRAGALTVPRRAIRRDGGAEHVRVRRDGAWIDREIRTGWRTDQGVEILSGLSAGESVRLNPE